MDSKRTSFQQWMRMQQLALAPGFCTMKERTWRPYSTIATNEWKSSTCIGGSKSQFRLRTSLASCSKHTGIKYNTDATIYKTLSFPVDSNQMNRTTRRNRNVRPDVNSNLSVGALARILVEEVMSSEFMLRIAHRCLESYRMRTNKSTWMCKLNYGDNYVTTCFMKEKSDDDTECSKRTVKIQKEAGPIPQICVQLCIERAEIKEKGIPCDPSDRVKDILDYHSQSSSGTNDIFVQINTEPSSCWISSDSANCDQKYREVTLWYLAADSGRAPKIKISNPEKGVKTDIKNLNMKKRVNTSVSNVVEKKSKASSSMIYNITKVTKDDVNTEINSNQVSSSEKNHNLMSSGPSMSTKNNINNTPKAKKKYQQSPKPTKKTCISYPLLTINEGTLNKTFDEASIILLGDMTLEGKGEEVKVFYNGKEKHFGSDIQTKEPILISRIARKRLIVVSKINEQLFAIRPRWEKVSLSTEPGEDSYIIVIIGTSSNNRDNDHAKWDKEVIEKVQKHKKVSMRGDGKKHNESFGRYFGLGMTAKFTTQNYGPFVAKPSKRKPEDLKLTNKFDILLKNEASQMHRQIDEVLPGFVKESFSVIQGVIDRLNAEADKSHEKVSCVPADGMIDDSCCTAIVCENAQTLKFHEEQDASYTFIGVPFFADNVGNKMDHFKFQFRWEACKEESKGIDIYLTPGTVISYSGMLIMHRQVKHLERNGMFYNLSMYHNKRLLCTMNAKLEEIRKKEIKRLLTTRK